MNWRKKKLKYLLVYSGGNFDCNESKDGVVALSYNMGIFNSKEEIYKIVKEDIEQEKENIISSFYDNNEEDIKHFEKCFHSYTYEIDDTLDSNLVGEYDYTEDAYCQSIKYMAVKIGD